MSSHRTPYLADAESSHTYPPAVNEKPLSSSSSGVLPDEDPEKKGHAQEVQISAGDELGKFRFAWPLPVSSSS